jgi:serine/threonine protein kinase/Tfp pilus assembly protein PilF
MKCPKCQFDNPDATNFCGKCGVPLTADARMADSLTKTLATPLPVIAKDKLIAGKYRIIEEVGHGGMGVVYKAEDLKLKRCVALKFLPPHLMDSPELKERFLIEAQAAAALSHPNICVIHEVGESEERPYIAMEYVEGETLRDKLKNGPLKPEEALDYAVQIAAGLGAAHRKGIIHRDIKSANIMVTEQGQAKVMDFGLAKLRGGASLTKSQTTLGTVAYMSPEQARGGDQDQRTDIWSLGVVLYEMHAGKLPFQGDHDQAVIHSILHEAPESLKKVRPDLRPEVAQIAGQALAKRPAERYQTMEEFREDLEAVAEGLKPLKARPARRIFGIRTAYVYVSLMAVLGLLFGLNIGGLRTRLTGGASAVGRPFKLAVLPFENLTGDPEQELLSDGMTQEMISQLSSLHPARMGVIARTSVMRYKKSGVPIDQIGRELDVAYVLEGTARREGERVRISAELIQVRDQTQLWSKTYEREATGFLAMQSDIARKVADALALKLLPSEEAQLAKARTVSPEAYEAYLKSIHYREMLSKEGYDAAERYLNLALEKDPNYAAAWAGLSRVWGGRQQMGWASSKEASLKTKEAAAKALELDDTEVEAHRALAGLLTWLEWDWGAAEREWKLVLELDPGYADSLSSYSHFLMHMGRKDEAMAMIEKALELDPFNVKIQSFYAVDLNFVGRHDEAIAASRKALGMQPNSPLAMTALMTALFAEGMYDEALALEKERCAGDAELLEALERGYAEWGYRGAWKRLADAHAARFGKPGGIQTYHLANLYLHAGDKERAFEWLEKAYVEHNRNMPYITLHFDSLRSDPRFQDLLRRMKLPAGEKNKNP